MHKLSKQRLQILEQAYSKQLQMSKEFSLKHNLFLLIFPIWSFASYYRWPAVYAHCLPGLIDFQR